MATNNGCLTKAELIDAVYEDCSVEKGRATEIVEDLIELIKKGLETDRKVMISGFGVFEVKSKTARQGRNPQTGDRITLTSRNVVRFKPSQILLDAVNNRENQ